MESSEIIGFIILFLLILGSAFFSSAETALMSVSIIKLKSSENINKKSTPILLNILEDKEKMLSAILIGNNIVNIAASALTTTLALKIFGSYAVSFFAGVLTLIILVFGEISPKTLASRNPEKFVYFYARPIQIIIFILIPFIYVVNILAGLVLKVLGSSANLTKDSVTQEEIRTMLEVSHEDGNTSKEEHKMINNIFDFGETIVRDLMTPRIDIVAIDVSATYEEFIDIYKKEQYTRIPVYEEKIDNIIGILNIKDVLLNEESKEFNIRDIMREPLYTYEQMSIAKLLLEMKKNFHNMAIVLDEYGTAAGLLSLEDILEEIFGDIRDEYDRDEEENIKKLKDGKYLVDASMKLDDINEYLSLDLYSDEYESIGGLLIEILGELPKEKDSVQIKNVKLVVTKMDGNRIEKLLLYIS